MMTANPKAFCSTQQPVHWARFKIGPRTGLFHWITVVEPPLAGSACGRMMFLSSQIGYADTHDRLDPDDVCRTCLNTDRSL